MWQSSLGHSRLGREIAHANSLRSATCIDLLYLCPSLDKGWRIGSDNVALGSLHGYAIGCDVLARQHETCMHVGNGLTVDDPGLWPVNKILYSLLNQERRLAVRRLTRST